MLSNGRVKGIHGFYVREIGYGSLVWSIDKTTDVKLCWLKGYKLVLYIKYKNLILNSILKFLVHVMIENNYSLLKA